MIDNKKKKNQIVMNNLSSNLYQDMLNNKLKKNLFLNQNWEDEVYLMIHS